MNRPGYSKAKTRLPLTSGDSVRIAREMLNLTQEQLAEISGLKQTTLSAIEKNRINLGVHRAKVLARVLKVHPAVLLFPNWELEERESA